MRTLSIHSITVYLALLSFLMPGYAVHANDGDSFTAKSPEGIELNFKVISEQEKTAEVTGMAESNTVSDYGRLTVPSEANGYSVISIGERAFKNNNDIRKVLISEGVQVVRNSAFLYCPRLRTVILPSTIRELEDYSLQSWIENVVVLSAEPVKCGYHVFDTAIEELIDSYTGEIIIIDQNTTWHIGTYNQAVLFVPKGSKRKYAETDSWSLFHEIEETDGLSPDFEIPPIYDCQRTAFRLFDQLRVTKRKTDNICFSPLSVQLTISMVQNGADGNTLLEMKEAMGVGGYSDGELNAFNQSLTQALTSRPEFIAEQWRFYGESDEEARKRYDAAYPMCEIANSVWHRPDITLYGIFTETARSYYDAGVGSVWFDTQEGIDEINRWVNDKTHALIPQIYSEPQPSDLAVVLADALYFKGAWQHPFDKADTRPGVFHNAGGDSVMTSLMTVNADYQSTATDKFQTITLPYGNGDFSMTIFLPVQVTKLPELTRQDWENTINQEPVYTSYALTLPRFEFDGRHELNNVLKKMGMKDAFSPSAADFTRMADNPLCISKVYQLDKISVDEEGTEAAAVTVIGMDETCEPDPTTFKPFTVDRPFYFTIESRKEKAVLFVGRVATLEGEPAGQEPGDVNADNKVDISDVVAIINVIAGNGNFAFEKVDINHDEKVDISDVVAVINIIAGNMSD